MADKATGGAGEPKKRRNAGKSAEYIKLEKEFGLYVPDSDEEYDPVKEKEMEEIVEMKKYEKEYPLKSLDVNRDPRFGVSFMLLGSTKSGKTTMLNYIMNKYFKDSVNVFMSQSLHADIYKNARKTMACAPTYIPEVVRTCYLINKNVGTKHQYDFNIVLDDVVGAKNDTQMTKLLTIYRNSRISCILSAQSPIMLSSVGRNNINHVLLGRFNSDESVKYAVEKYLRTYFPVGMRVIDCMRLYRILTEDHTFFWINTLEGTVCRVRLSADDLRGIEH
jgi:hypothetical protein